jgi:hypothetical protein
MDPIASTSDASEAIVFRPSKRRKIYRQRALDDKPNQLSSIPSATEVAESSPVPISLEDNPLEMNDLEGARVSMAEILRMRKLHKQRVGGVEFRASATSSRGDDIHDGALVLHEEVKADGEREEGQSAVGSVRRFAKQTGMVGDVDKHM